MISTPLALVVAHLFVAQLAAVNPAQSNLIDTTARSLSRADSTPASQLDRVESRRYALSGHNTVGVFAKPLVSTPAQANQARLLVPNATSTIIAGSAASIFDGVPEWMAPVMSAIVPGTGQVRLRQDRFAAFMAIELYSWVQYTRHRRDGARARDSYQALAADVARSIFSATPPPGDFEYYESMEHFLESGAFNLGGGATLRPEADERTFNGFLWLRARETYWADPAVEPPVGSDAFVRAIRYYQERAVPDEFRWSWRNAQLEHDIFRQTISRSNDSYRRSVRDLGIIIGNHILSMVDAFVAVRLRMRAEPESDDFSVSASILLNRGRR